MEDDDEAEQQIMHDDFWGRSGGQRGRAGSRQDPDAGVILVLL